MIRVIIHGLGGIGQRIARNALDKKSIEIIGAVTARPEDLGKDLWKKRDILYNVHKYINIF